MPPCVIYFDSIGVGYINNLLLSGIITFVSCAIVADLIFVRYIEELGIQMGNVGWKSLSTGAETSFLRLIWETTKSIVLTILLMPLALLRWIWNGLKSIPAVFKSFRAKCIKVYHWRDVVVRPAKTHVYTHADAILMGLHSTDWKFDANTDEKSLSTRRVLEFHQYAWFLHVVAILAAWILWYRFNPLGQITSDWLNFNVLYRGLWLLLIPYCLITMFGFFTPRIPPSEEKLAKTEVKRQFIRKFYIVSVTKGCNDEAVRRAYNSLVHLNGLHPSIEVVILSDEPYHYPDLNNVVCPEKFQSANGKSKYKARALEYFRIQANLNEYDWIMHLDEESVIDGESVRRSFEFIRYGEHHLGQGIILYNGYQYWKNWFFTVADSIRVGDDLARFNLQYSLIKRPVFGVHGSFLLTNGELENEVTWGFGSLAEDFEFSHAAWEKGFTVGAIHGIVREQSPMSVIDFMKQRRRWYLGICQIKGIHALPAIAIKLWTAGIICLAVTILNIPFNFILDDNPTVFWIAFLSAFCYANIYWVYVYGMIFQDIDYGYPWYIVLLHIPIVIVLQPVVSVLEAAAIVWAMMDSEVDFEVIKK
jgi:hypothetical protein